MKQIFTQSCGQKLAPWPCYTDQQSPVFSASNSRQQGNNISSAL